MRQHTATSAADVCPPCEAPANTTRRRVRRLPRADPTESDDSDNSDISDCDPAYCFNVLDDDDDHEAERPSDQAPAASGEPPVLTLRDWPTLSAKLQELRSRR